MGGLKRITDLQPRLRGFTLDATLPCRADIKPALGSEEAFGRTELTCVNLSYPSLSLFIQLMCFPFSLLYSTSNLSVDLSFELKTSKVIWT